MFDDKEILDSAGDVEEEMFVLVSATQLRNKKGSNLVITVDICTMIGIDCESPNQSTLFDCT